MLVERDSKLGFEPIDHVAHRHDDPHQPLDGDAECMLDWLGLPQHRCPQVGQELLDEAGVVATPAATQERLDAPTCEPLSGCWGRAAARISVAAWCCSFEAELGLLVAEAHRLLADDAQGVLDLGLTPAIPQARLVEPASGLFPSVPPVREVVARPRVLKTFSSVLYEALAGVYAALGFDAVADEVFRDLVIARVVEPTSLLDADRVLAEMGRVSASLTTRKRTLRRAHGGAYRDQIAAACFTHASTSGDVSLVLYDVTTLYFLSRELHQTGDGVAPGLAVAA